jgi:hypothetical protein
VKKVVRKRRKKKKSELKDRWRNRSLFMRKRQQQLYYSFSPYPFLAREKEKFTIRNTICYGDQNYFIIGIDMLELAMIMHIC